MFCPNCGSQISDNAKFCSSCGAKISEFLTESTVEADAQETVANAAVEANTEIEADKEPERVKNNTLGDKVIDVINSKLNGKKFETIRISMEDMTSLIQKLFLSTTSDPAEIKKIKKAATGSALGVVSYITGDGRYEMKSYVVMSLGGKFDILHPTDSNWVRIYDHQEGKGYQYSSLAWGKFKKAVEKL